MVGSLHTRKGSQSGGLACSQRAKSASSSRPVHPAPDDVETVEVEFDLRRPAAGHPASPRSNLGLLSVRQRRGSSG
jgi:hypothetical protein